MNRHIDDDIPPFDDASHEREWLAQESAMRRERLHLDSTGDDARARRYRLIARALREPPQEGLPADFAQRVVARAAIAPAAATRFECVLMIALAVALLTAAGVVTAIYGSEWLPSFSALLPAPRAPANGWLLAFGGCLGASWLLARWKPHGPG